MRRPFVLMGLLAVLAAPCTAQSRPFGTVRQQAERQQAWLAERIETVLPALMRREGVDMWVIPMREYNEDPVFSSLVSPTTFAARRRTIYVFHDRGSALGVERLALGGTSQGGVYEAVRSSRRADSGDGRQAELWGDEQWALLREVIEARNPRVVAINTSRTFAFADGLTAGEEDGMREALGPGIVSRLRPAEALAVDFIAARLPDEARFYRELMLVVHQMIGEMFSERVVVPGVTRTSDLVWWWRQRTTDLGLDTWFQPSVSVQRQGASGADLGEDPVIQRGDVLHCDVGLTALRLNTDTQHQAYVLLPGETDAPPGLRVALGRANRLQDLLLEEIRPGRTGNEVLAATRARMGREGLDGTVYTHPIGMHGHGAGPLIGLWDRQEGVPGRGDHRVMANSWFSSELQVTSPVAEWGGQRVRMALEEDFLLDAEGRPHWVLGRQDRLHLVR